MKAYLSENLKNVKDSIYLSYSSSAITDDDSPRHNLSSNYALPKDFNSLERNCDNLSTTSIDEIIDSQNDNRNSKNSKAKPSRVKARKHTELCKSWIENNECQYGAKCKFAHGEHELRKKPESSLRNYKTIPCQKFNDQMHCPYGSRCRYIHNDIDAKQNSSYRLFYLYLLSPCTSMEIELEEIPNLQAFTRPLLSYSNITQLSSRKANLI